MNPNTVYGFFLFRKENTPYNETPMKGPMMNEKIEAARTHIRKHRAKYAAAVTLVTCLVVHRLAVNEWNEFLDEYDLTEEYYGLSEE